MLIILRFQKRLHVLQASLDFARKLHGMTTARMSVYQRD
jgi:hypothetical protein